MAGFEGIAGDDNELLGLSAEAALKVIALIIAQRERHEHALSLVWTGPRVDGDRARDTAIVLRELLKTAQREVFVAGYTFDHSDEILGGLAAAIDVCGSRLECTVVLDVKQRASVASDVPLVASREIRAFLSAWPGKTKPTVYYDPRTCSPQHYASMHAKCVVVDRERALISSANFTNRGQTRNIEVGVLIEDPRFASELLAQWNSLIQRNLLKPFRG